MGKIKQEWGVTSRTAALLCLAALCFALYGCTGAAQNGGKAGDSVKYAEDGMEDSSEHTEDFFYLVRNPIEIQNRVVRRSEDGWTESGYLEIDGLSDQKVQDQINLAIREAYEKLDGTAELPPYRGVLADYPPGTSPSQIKTYVNVEGNFDNLLSLSVCRDFFYEEKPPIHQVIPLNLDLNTGEEIFLSDLFLKGSKWKELLNAAVLDSVMSGDSAVEDDGMDEYWDRPKLLRPFSGVSMDQKFLLNEQGICLLFDYDSPELAGPDAYFPVLINVSFDQVSGMLGIVQRYYEGNHGIFTDEAARERVLVSGWNSSGQLETERFVGAIRVILNQSISEGLPKAVEHAAEEFWDDQEISKEALMSRSPEIAFIGELGANPEIQVSVSAGRVGPFDSVERFVMVFLQKEGEEARYGAEQDARTFWAGSGKEVTLSELFQDGFDYEQVIRQYLEKKEDEGQYPFLTQVTLERFIRERRGFSAGTEGIWLFTNPIPQEGTAGVEPLSVQIPYLEFGYENLTVFGDAREEKDER